MYKSWEDLITSRFVLGRLSKKGWYQLKCPVCHDTKVRAGFRFDGLDWGYNCFRGSCGLKIRWKPGIPVDEVKGNITKLFNSAGIREEEWSYLLYSIDSIDKPIVSSIKTIDIIEPKEVHFPTGTKKLSESDLNHTKVQWAIHKLYERKIITDDDISALDDFYITVSPPLKDELDFRDRLIIPFYYRNKLVFFQGLWINPNYKTKIKYLNTDQTERDTLFYNMDELERNTTDPLFVVEGLFDAWWYQNTVSAMSNILTEQQIERLKRCNRRKIIIPDYDKAGYKLAELAAENGWEVSFPDWGSIKDLDEAVKQYGKLIVLKEIMSNIKSTKDKILNAAGHFCRN